MTEEKLRAELDEIVAAHAMFYVGSILEEDVNELERALTRRLLDLGSNGMAELIILMLDDTGKPWQLARKILTGLRSTATGVTP